MKHHATLLPLLVSLSMTAHAQAPGEPTPIGIDSDIADLDIFGTWNYSTSNHKVQGKCPNGTPMRGTLQISRGAGGLGLQVMSGAVCNPASMCSYTGEFNSGNALFSNVDDVDDEGGTASNAMNLHFSSEESGWGEVSSTYTHPKGFECHWTHHITLTRKKAATDEAHGAPELQRK
jgi:hypothetical protein